MVQGHRNTSPEASVTVCLTGTQKAFLLLRMKWVMPTSPVADGVLSLLINFMQFIVKFVSRDLSCLQISGVCVCVCVCVCVRARAPGVEPLAFSFFF